MTTEKTKKNENNYCCEICDFNTCKKTDYTRHIVTQKHINNITTDNSNVKNEKFCCKVCNKLFIDRSGLWRHKQKCKSKKETCESKELCDNDLIIMLINDNKELRNLLLEQSKETNELQNTILEVIKNGTYNNNSHNTNSHNKSFNLQFFLNETCKDAMNIMDFVESIQLQLSDLEKVGEIGYVDGISNIIVKNLKALDVTQRPVHCTDKKREVLYVKDENKWEKQDEDNVKLRKVIKKVTDKNMRLIPKYKEKYPDCNKSISRYSDQYNKIVVESMGGSGDNDHEKATKIIKNISKQVLVEKEPESATI
jgi:hypothetical protein